MTDPTTTPEPTTREPRSGPCVGCGADHHDALELSPDPIVAEWQRRQPLRCDTCAAALDAQIAERQAADDDERRLDRFRQRLSYSGIPKAFHGPDCTLDSLDAAGRADALAAGHRFAAGELLGLVLTGPFGIGKTSIAAAIAKRFMRDQGALRWLRVHEVTINLDLAFDDPIRAATIRALSTTSAIVLDDLDKARPTVRGAEPVFVAVDRAVSELQPLIATTNLDLAQLSEHWPAPFGEGIASRLAGYCETWDLVGDDRRVAE